MSTLRCPGQDQRYWRPEDIFEVHCPHCGGEIEFWKDEPLRVCRACSKEVRNPRIDLGCSRWCRHGVDCLRHAGEPVTEALVSERLEAVLEKILEDQPTRFRRALAVRSCVDDLLGGCSGDALVAKAAALFSGALIGDDGALPDSPESALNPFRDFPSLQAVLEAAGLEALVAAQVSEIHRAIMAGHSLPVPEFDTVRDAVQRERISCK